MDRGDWRATVHGVTRVGHDLVTNNSNNNDTWGSYKWRKEARESEKVCEAEASDAIRDFEDKGATRQNAFF